MNNLRTLLENSNSNHIFSDTETNEKINYVELTKDNKINTITLNDSGDFILKEEKIIPQYPESSQFKVVSSSTNEIIQ